MYSMKSVNHNIFWHSSLPLLLPLRAWQAFLKFSEVWSEHLDSEEELKQEERREQQHEYEAAGDSLLNIKSGVDSTDPVYANWVTVQTLLSVLCGSQRASQLSFIGFSPSLILWQFGGK